MTEKFKIGYKCGVTGTSSYYPEKGEFYFNFRIPLCKPAVRAGHVSIKGRKGKFSL